ncbi:MAG: response regulator transcription factor [Christensenellaceae bacterium]|nr:response regulator transcription factor [Christensenellaceae bacterium]
MHKILVVEDEKAISELLKYGFEREGYAVVQAFDGKTALDKIDSDTPDVILLDLMLPDIDGLSICRTVTRQKSIPIIIVSAKNDQLDKLIGLEYGADDYITKPFDIREVILRVKSVLRRVERTNDELASEDIVLTAGDVTVDLKRHEVKNGGEVVELTPKEFSLLEVLMKNRGSVLTRGDLLKKVWDFEYIGDTRTVDIHIQRLRKKLKDDGLIITVFGVGYKIAEEE